MAKVKAAIEYAYKSYLIFGKVCMNMQQYLSVLNMSVTDYVYVLCTFNSPCMWINFFVISASVSICISCLSSVGFYNL